MLSGDRLNMQKLTLCSASGYNQENTKGNQLIGKNILNQKIIYESQFVFQNPII